jgi:hypothetical protein
MEDIQYVEYCRLFQPQTLFGSCERCQGGSGCGVVSYEKALGMILCVADEAEFPVVLLQRTPMGSEKCRSKHPRVLTSEAAKNFHRVEGTLYYSQRGFCANIRDGCSSCLESSPSECPCPVESNFGLCNCYQLDALMAETLLERVDEDPSKSGDEVILKAHGKQEEDITIRYTYVGGEHPYL